MRFKNILVPVDGSAYATKALELAVQLEDTFDATLHVLSVYKHMSYSENTHSLIRNRQATETPDSARKAEARALVDAYVADAEKMGASGVKGAVRRGKPSKVIVEYAAEHKIDCIVMGGRGLGDVGGVLLGSVSHKVAALSPCTVITVK